MNYVNDIRLTWVLSILQVVYMVQVRVVVVVVQDAFQIGAIQHCHGTPAAPAVTHAQCTLSQIYSTSTIVVTSRYLLGHARALMGWSIGAVRSAPAPAIYHCITCTCLQTKSGKMVRFTFSHRCYPSLRNVDSAFDKAVSWVSARGSAVTGACAQHCWRAVVYWVRVRCHLPDSRPRTHLSDPGLSYHDTSCPP